MSGTRKHLSICSFFILHALCSGCFGPIEALYPPRVDEPYHSVYVINHNDWHTGIAVKRVDIPAGLWPQQQAFAGLEYVEVGWGDRDYYQAEQPTFWMALKAALWPTDSVLHISGFSGPVQRQFPQGEIVEIRISQRGFERLSAFIGESYAKDESGEVIWLGPGLYENSRFYVARGKFHLLKTCNTWIAKAVRATGCPITPLYAFTARNLIYQGKKCGAMVF